MNGFRDYEKYIAYQKTPLVGQSLSLVSWISVLLALSRTLFLHLFLLFCSNILCSIVILFLSLFNKRKKKLTSKTKQSPSSPHLSGDFPISLLPFRATLFKNIFLYTVFAVPPLSIFPPGQIRSLSQHWKCSCQGRFSVLSYLISSSFMKDISFLVYVTLNPLPGSHLTIFIVFLTYFSSSAIWLNQELPHNTIKSPYSSPLLPLRWSIIAMALTDICMLTAAKVISLAEIPPLGQQYIFQTCLLYVYIRMLWGHFRFNMSKSYFETFPKKYFLILPHRSSGCHYYSPETWNMSLLLLFILSTKSKVLTTH